jgi:hypothetical protein
MAKAASTKVNVVKKKDIKFGKNQLVTDTMTPKSMQIGAMSSDPASVKEWNIGTPFVNKQAMFDSERQMLNSS